jgi:hypothetical protein
MKEATTTLTRAAFLRVSGNVRGELAALFFRPIQRPKLLKQGTFDDGQHGRTIRLRSIPRKPSFAREALL